MHDAAAACLGRAKNPARSIRLTKEDIVDDLQMIVCYLIPLSTRFTHLAWKQKVRLKSKRKLQGCRPRAIPVVKTMTSFKPVADPRATSLKLCSVVAWTIACHSWWWRAEKRSYKWFKMVGSSRTIPQNEFQFPKASAHSWWRIFWLAMKCRDSTTCSKN